MELLVYCVDALNLTDAAMHSTYLVGPHTQFVESIPPTTGPAWTSFATGLSPPEHGINTASLAAPDKQIWSRVHLAPEVRRRLLYKVINMAGKSVGWWHMPVTSQPPGELDGWMTSGGLWWLIGSWPEGFYGAERQLPQFPPITKAPGFEPTDEALEKHDDDLFALCKGQLRQETDDCLRCAREIPVDVLFVYVWELDMATHLLYHDRVRFGELVTYIGDCLRQLMDELKPANCIVVSDHGGQRHPNPDCRFERADGHLDRRHRIMWEDGGCNYDTGDHAPLGMFSSTARFLPVLTPISVYPMTHAYDWVLSILGVKLNELPDIADDEDVADRGEDERLLINDRLKALGYL